MSFPRYDGREFESALTFDMRDDLDRQAYGSLLDMLLSWYSDARDTADGEILVDGIEGGEAYRHFRVEEIEVRAAVVEVSKRSRIVFLTISNRGDRVSGEDGESEYPYEYDRWTENMLAQCVLCGIPFGADSRDEFVAGGNNALCGPVYDVETGEEFKYVGDSSGDEPLAHEDCYEEHRVEKAREEHHSLSSFSSSSSGGSA